MERITHYDDYRHRYYINNDHGDVIIDELNYAIGNAVDKLAAYEDAEEHGLLARLPCKVGDTVFVINGKSIYKAEVDLLHIDRIGLKIEAVYNHFGLCCASGYYGKKVFLTREEAEKALNRGTDNA